MLPCLLHVKTLSCKLSDCLILPNLELQEQASCNNLNTISHAAPTVECWVFCPATLFVVVFIIFLVRDSYIALFISIASVSLVLAVNGQHFTQYVDAWIQTQLSHGSFPNILTLPLHNVQSNMLPHIHNSGDLLKTQPKQFKSSWNI